VDVRPPDQRRSVSRWPRSACWKGGAGCLRRDAKTSPSTWRRSLARRS
jgi:hypothetical protein